MIEAINLRPLDNGLEVELVGDIAGMVRVASEGDRNKKAAPEGAAVQEAFSRSVKVGAGARTHLYRTRFITRGRGREAKYEPE